MSLAYFWRDDDAKDVKSTTPGSRERNNDSVDCLVRIYVHA